MPVDVTVNLIKTAMIKSAAAGKSDFLVDGFPRNQDNYDGWHAPQPLACISCARRQLTLRRFRVMHDAAAEVCFALVFSCSEEVLPGYASARARLTPAAQVMMQRLLSRAQSSGRVDDNVESIQKRFRCGGAVAGCGCSRLAQGFRHGERASSQTFRGRRQTQDGACKLLPLQAAVALTPRRRTALSLLTRSSRLFQRISMR